MAALAGRRRSKLPSRLPLPLPACLQPGPLLPATLPELLATLAAELEGCMPPPLPPPPLPLLPLATSSRCSLLLEGSSVAAVCPVDSTLGQSGRALRK
jgi:hypothetical protein